MGRKALVLVVAVLAVGCGPGSDRTPVADTLPADVTTKTSIVGGSPKQRELLREILTGLGPTPIETIEIDDQPEKGWGPPDAVALRVETSSPSVLASWHGNLIANAFKERSHEWGLPPIAYLAEADSASTLEGTPIRPARDAMTLEEAGELVESLRKTLSQHGAKERHIELLRPRRLAFVVDIEVKDPGAFLRGRIEEALEPLLLRAGRGYDGYDGHYLKIVDGDGRHVLEFGWYPFGGLGSVRPDLKGCTHLGGQGTFEREPPCPAK